MRQILGRRPRTTTRHPRRGMFGGHTEADWSSRHGRAEQRLDAAQSWPAAAYRARAPPSLRAEVATHAARATSNGLVSRTSAFVSCTIVPASLRRKGLEHSGQCMAFVLVKKTSAVGTRG